MSEILSLLDQKKIPYRQTGQEAIANCMFCQDTKGHLYINTTKDIMYCHKCQEAGNIWKLRKHYGIEVKPIIAKKKEYNLSGKDIEYQEQLKKDNDEALKFLMAERGFKSEIIRQFKLGKKGDYIAIPYYKDNELVNFKYRHIKKKEFTREPGYPSALFNQDAVDKKKDIIVTEGEFDCIAAVQMGFTNTVSVSTGAGGANGEWIDFFDNTSGDIYIAYDNDDSGEKGAIKLAEKIGYSRCYRVLLPVKDFNECLLSGYTKNDIDISKSKAYTPQDFYHVSKLFSEIDDIYAQKELVKGIQLNGWNEFNKHMGGIREQEVTIITGETASGKTTFAINILYQLCMQEKNVLIISSEIPAPKVLVKIINIHTGKPLYELTEDEYSKCILELSEKNIFFVKVHGKMSMQDIRNHLNYANRKYNVKYALLDHLHFFVEAGSENFVQDIERFMRNIVAVSFESGMSIFLIAHPAKLGNTQGVVTLNDIKGSSSVKQDSHNVLTLCRMTDEESDTSHPVIVSFLKIRDESGITGAKRYEYNPRTLTYEEHYDSGTTEMPKLRGKSRKSKRYYENSSYKE